MNRISLCGILTLELNLKVLNVRISIIPSKKISPTFLFLIEIPVFPHPKESVATIGMYHSISIPDKSCEISFFYGKYLLQFGIKRFKPFIHYCDFFATQPWE